MKTPSQSFKSLFLLLIITVAASLAHAAENDAWDEQETVLVGRISHIEGQLSRYNPETDEWIATSREAPFGTDDLLFSEADSRAEFIMPNNTWARIDGDTRIQMVSIDQMHTQLDIALGNARLFNKSTAAEIVASTPFGTVSAPPGSAFDLYVEESAVTVIALSESIYFTHNASRELHEVRSDGSALLADTRELTAVPGQVLYAWDRWNRNMDDLWSARLNARGQSTAYLPPELSSEAYALDTHGMWENVYYDGGTYRFWRPIHVGFGWAPFTSGAWMVWHGDHVWVPSEPFGFVTHHYGNWIFTAGLWYWAPPVTHVMIRAHLPLLKIGFGWYPGRVAWIHSGAHIGWIPLAPREPYYSRRHWGRRSLVISKTNGFHDNLSRLKHKQHAVVIHRNHLYRSSNYRSDRLGRTPHGVSGSAFRRDPVPNQKMITNAQAMGRKDRFKPAGQTSRPARSIARSRNDGQKLYATKPHTFHPPDRPSVRYRTEPGVKNTSPRQFKPGRIITLPKMRKETRPAARPLAGQRAETSPTARVRKTFKPQKPPAQIPGTTIRHHSDFEKRQGKMIVNDHRQPQRSWNQWNDPARGVGNRRSPSANRFSSPGRSYPHNH